MSVLVETPSGLTLSASPRVSPEPRWLLWTAIAVAVTLRVVFWVYTDRIWEDALITVRHAENAARGAGLTHHPGHGSPVHGFTSPISVLIPLVSELFLPGSGIPFQKLVSIGASIAAIYCAYRALRHPEIDLSTAPLAFVLGYLALEHHQILFGMAGMETQCIVAILWWSIWMFLEQRTVWLGVACGVALWGRPDGLFLDAALWCCLLASRRWKAAAIVPIVAAVVFLPWVGFTEWYYGSFVPHTVVAKKNALATFYSGFSQYSEFFDVWRTIINLRWDRLRPWLSPGHGGTGFGVVSMTPLPEVVQNLYLAVAACGALNLLGRGPGRILSVYALGYLAYILICMPIAAGWYLPPWLSIVAALFAEGLDWFATSIPKPGVRRVTAAIGWAYLAAYALVPIRGFPVERLVQHDIERGVRTVAGRWLDNHARPEHWVCCECLGYLGYYANRPMLDFPGLASPRSVKALHEQPRTLMALIDREHPEWLMLRPNELSSLQASYPATCALYVEERRFVASEDYGPQLDRLLGMDSKDFQGDREFVALRRQDVAMRASESKPSPAP